MHFKSAAILCALYFVTVTQSVGLNEDQLDEIRLLFTTHKNGMDNISKDDIKKLGKSIGINNISDFKYKEGVANARQLQDLLVFLANNDKKTDNLNPNLSPIEVRFYVDLFSEKDRGGNHDGLLDYGDVIEVIDVLDLENWTHINCSDFNCSKPTKLLFENGFDEDKKINASDFLHGIWRVKPVGQGLDQKQVEDLIILHNDYKIDDDNHINPVEIMQFIKKISLVKKDYESELAFDPKRKAALELQDVLLISSEYSKEEKVGTVYPTHSVRHVLLDFSKKDFDKDGLLGNDEVIALANHYESTSKIEENITSFMIQYDTNKDKHLDIAELFMALFKEDVYLSSYDKHVNPSKKILRSFE